MQILIYSTVSRTTGSACERLLRDKQLRWQKGPEHSQKPEQHPGQVDPELSMGCCTCSTRQFPAPAPSHGPARAARDADFPASHFRSHLLIPVLRINSKAWLNPRCRDINCPAPRLQVCVAFWSCSWRHRCCTTDS